MNGQDTITSLTGLLPAWVSMPSLPLAGERSTNASATNLLASSTTSAVTGNSFSLNDHLGGDKERKGHKQQGSSSQANSPGMGVHLMQMTLTKRRASMYGIGGLYSASASTFAFNANDSRETVGFDAYDGYGSPYGYADAGAGATSDGEYLSSPGLDSDDPSSRRRARFASPPPYGADEIDLEVANRLSVASLPDWEDGAGDDADDDVVRRRTHVVRGPSSSSQGKTRPRSFVDIFNLADEGDLMAGISASPTQLPPPISAPAGGAGFPFPGESSSANASAANLFQRRNTQPFSPLDEEDEDSASGGYFRPNRGAARGTGTGSPRPLSTPTPGNADPFNALAPAVGAGVAAMQIQKPRSRVSSNASRWSRSNLNLNPNSASQQSLIPQVQLEESTIRKNKRYSLPASVALQPTSVEARMRSSFYGKHTPSPSSIASSPSSSSSNLHSTSTYATSSSSSASGVVHPQGKRERKESSSKRLSFGLGAGNGLGSQMQGGKRFSLLIHGRTQGHGNQQQGSSMVGGAGGSVASAAGAGSGANGEEGGKTQGVGAAVDAGEAEQGRNDLANGVAAGRLNELLGRRVKV
jgi:hypothetical protein